VGESRFCPPGGLFWVRFPKVPQLDWFRGVRTGETSGLESGPRLLDFRSNAAPPCCCLGIFLMN